MPPPHARALVLGDVNVDISLAVDAYPDEGGDAQAQSRTLGSGGGGLNAAVALRSFGADVSLLGCIGCDPLGDIATKTAKVRGVDLTGLQRSADVPTGTCVLITSPGGERTLLSHRGANTRLTKEALSPSLFRDARLLLVFGYAFLASPQRDTAAAAVGIARSHGCMTALDLGLAVVRRPDTVVEQLPNFDVVLLNERELLVFASCQNMDKAIAKVFRCGVSTVVVKRGRDGCVVARSGMRTSHPAWPVDAMDTTACGDAFSAAFAWNWALHPDADACARVANRVGALTAACKGAAESIPSQSKLANAIESEFAMHST